MVIHDYDPAHFEADRAKIGAALGKLALLIEHVGSTSVPGLAAKPIIDILVVVPDAEDDAKLIPALTAAGYGLRVIDPGHRMFRSPARDVHVHVWAADSDEVRKYLVFRDWLRVAAEDRVLFESVKRDLAGRQWGRMDDDADAKSDVVVRIMARAEPWATRPIV